MVLIAILLVGIMQWPGAATTPTTGPSTTASTSTTAAPTAPTTAAPTTAAPTTAAPTTAAPTTAAPTTAAPTTAAPTTAGGSTTAPADTGTTAPAETTATTTGISPEEKARIEAAAAAKAREVDAANARLDDLSGALRTLNSRVSSQSARVDYANQQVLAAQAKVSEAGVAVAAAEQELVDLEARLQGQAIRNFMGGDSDDAAVLVTGDPNQSIRMQAMLAEVTQSDIDLSSTLISAHEDLAVQKAEAQNAVEAFEALQLDANQELQILQGDRQAQANLTASAEARLDHLLSERAALGSLGPGSDPAEAELVNQLLASGSGSAPINPNVAIPATISESEIRLAGNGIRVHESIVGNVQGLLAAAEAAGYALAGGGYRDPAAQIATRRSNCGTSNYAIYEMPASQCSPPTARPGQSMHEKGMAIDFTYNGQLIRSRSSVAFVWLSQNAAKYGLCNLPSEPWHWSTNCK